MKKFLTIFLVSSALFYLIMRFYYDLDYSYFNVSNALFIVGLPLFLFSILMITGATEIFVGFNFAFRKMFSRGDAYVGMTISEYKDLKKERFDTTEVAIAGILVSLIFNGISLYIAFALFN